MNGRTLVAKTVAFAIGIYTGGLTYDLLTQLLQFVYKIEETSRIVDMAPALSAVTVFLFIFFGLNWLDSIRATLVRLGRIVLSIAAMAAISYLYFIVANKVPLVGRYEPTMYMMMTAFSGLIMYGFTLWGIWLLEWKPLAEQREELGLIGAAAVNYLIYAFAVLSADGTFAQSWSWVVWVSPTALVGFNVLARLDKKRSWGLEKGFQT